MQVEAKGILRDLYYTGLAMKPKRSEMNQKRKNKKFRAREEGDGSTTWTIQFSIPNSIGPMHGILYVFAFVFVVAFFFEKEWQVHWGSAARRKKHVDRIR